MRRLGSFLLLCILAGCSSPADVRSRLESVVQPDDGLQQTQFAYIGTVATPDGPLYVATQRLVITGMPAPRGQAWLHLFDKNYSLVNSYSLSNLTQPLWCEGTKIYLFGFGYHEGILPDEELAGLFRYPDQEAEREFGYPTGNVIDFCNGARSPVMRREWRYGSSGGIYHDPMKLSE